jgi:actin-like ATPase involved in cell morphogenesis
VVYGLDFGTSCSSLVVGHPDGSTTLVCDPLVVGSHAGRIPSAIFIGEDGQVAVGTRANNLRGGARSRHFSELKRDLGASAIKVGEVRYEVHELVARILSYLRELAEQIAGPPLLTVCTVPATWKGHRRELMRQASELAGFDPTTTHFISEPEAAASYVISQLSLSERARNLLIYDFGGGTFDCAAVSARPDGSDVLETGGLAQLGGMDLDAIVLGFIEERFPESIAQLVSNDGQPEMELRRKHLHEHCEEIKIKLSARSLCSELLTELRPPTELKLTRAEFEPPVEMKVEETLLACDQMLERCGIAWKELDLVVPVGGSSLTPAVGRMLASRGQVVARVDEPDLAVVRGATQWARRISAERPLVHRMRTLALSKPMRRFDGLRAVNVIAFPPDSGAFAAGCADEVVRVWDLHTRGLTRHLHHGHWVTDVSYSGDGLHLVTAGRDGVVKIWGENDEPLREIPRRPGRPVAHKASLSRDGQIVAAHRGEAVEIVRKDGSVLHTIAADRTGGMAVGGDGRLVVVATAGKACVHDLQTGVRLREIANEAPWPGADLRDLAVSHDCTAVAGGCARTGKVFVWDSESGSDRFVASHSSGPAWAIGRVSVAFSADDRWLASVGGLWLRLWDLDAGGELCPPVALDAIARDVTFSQDGNYLAVAAGNGWRVWLTPGS